MTTIMQKQSTQPHEDLPRVVVLRSGAQFSPRDERWRFRDGVAQIYIDFDSLPPEVAPLRACLKKTLIDFFERNSPSYARNMFYRFRDLAEVIAEPGLLVHEISAAHLMNFASHCGSEDKLGRESQVSAVLTRWHALGLRGVAHDAVDFLKSRKKKGNRKGQAVRTLDPVEGPFTEIELQGLMSAVTRAYADNLIDEHHFMLTWLVALTGQRACQYCALKVKDLLRKEAAHQITFQIDIPRAKQRNEVTRESFLRRPLPHQFGKSLWQYAQKVREENKDLGEEAPMFPSTSRQSDVYQLAADFRLHADPAEMADRLARALKHIAPLSERTNAPLHITIGRFRDTLGTRAAQEGHGELVIAELLGHSDTQNVKCYVAVIPEIAERLDKQLAKALAPLVHAFTGEVLADKSNARRADDPSSLIVDYANTFEPVGNCGTKLDCHFHAPVACYTCHNFQAWADAPHEALLDELLAERERLMHTAGLRIAAINDRTIIAIQAVVDTCAQLKQDPHRGMIDG